MEYLSQEREELFASQVLAGLEDSCQGNQPISRQFRNPRGDVEVLTSIVPLLLDEGCWLVLTSSVVDQPGKVSLLGGAYWQKREIIVAASIFVASAILIMSLFVSIWLGLRRFAHLARDVSANIEEAETFADHNKVPELDGVAREFDRLVNTLRRSAQAVREHAEENAHAAKGPLAIIAQSLEPLKRSATYLDARGRRALELIELSVERLDDLISQARDIDTAEADLMTATRERVDLVALLRGLTESYRRQSEDTGIEFEFSGMPRVEIAVNREQMATAIENVLDNAVSFSPAHGRITIDVGREDRAVVVLIVDDGPGVTVDQLENIFERSVSLRPKPDRVNHADTIEIPNYGIGLWIARRNITYAGGTISAKNCAARGLEVTITLPAPNH
jgi:two-component system, OmpR family, sensor histidine kinase ChvG